MDSSNPSKNAKSPKWFPIIVALIGAVAIVLAPIITFVLNLTVTALPTSATPTRTIQIVGRVSDRDSSKPIQGALVSLEIEGIPNSVYSDVQGIFVFPVAMPSSPQNIRIRVESAGYHPFDKHFLIPPVNLNPLDIRLER